MFFNFILNENMNLFLILIKYKIMIVQYLFMKTIYIWKLIRTDNIIFWKEIFPDKNRNLKKIDKKMYLIMKYEHKNRPYERNMTRASK